MHLKEGNRNWKIKLSSHKVYYYYLGCIITIIVIIIETDNYFTSVKKFRFSASSCRG